jgi:acid-activated urea channel
MLGVTLLFVGIVLINNGLCGLLKVDGKATAVMNVFVGGITFVINVIHLTQGDYYAAGTGLLFTFTYLFAAANNIFALDLRPYGIYSLFVVVNTLPAAWIAWSGGDWRMALIWLAWGVLWFTGFLEGTLKKNLGNFSASLAVLEGVITAWIPGFMMLANIW